MFDRANLSRIRKEDFEVIIAFNRAIMARHNSEFDCDYDILEKVIQKVNAASSADRESLLISRTARLLGGITFRQPFYDGNKETALAISLRYLNRNHLDLPIEDSIVKQGMYHQLMKMEFGTGNREAYEELESFLTKYVRKTKL